MRFPRGRTALRFATIGLLACGWACAAGGAGSLSAVILEANGQPAPLALVTLVEPGSSFRSEGAADSAAKIKLFGLPSGSYTIVARSPRTGGSARVTADIREGSNLDLTITLSPSWAVFLDREPRADLPDRGNYLGALRNATEATRGQEGGNLEGYTAYSPRGNVSLNAAGQRGQDNNFLIDGLDNNESWLRGASLLPPADGIEEVSLDEVYLPADTGHAAGGRIGISTRAGSGQFHGSAYDYLQNSAPNARNFFDGRDKPGLTQNRFGATAGGPLSKAGWFFFADTDVLREREGLTVMSTVPTVAQKAGFFGVTPIYDPLSITKIGDNVYGRSQFPNNQVPNSRVFLPSQRLIALYPDPNLPSTADNFRFTPALVQNNARFDGRSDKVVSSRSTVMVRTSYERSNQQSPGAFPAPAGAAESYAGSDSVQHADDAKTLVTAWEGGVSHSFVIRPAWINQFRASVAQLSLGAYANDRGLNAATALGIPGLGTDGLPAVNALGFTSLGAAEPVPMQIRTTNYEVADTVLWKTARHTWEFGAQAIRRQADGNASDWTSRGAFLFTPDYTGYPGTAFGDSIASLLTGYPTEVRRDVQLTTFQLRAWEWAVFVQDEFRIGSNLTVQAGVRYSLDPPVTEASQHLVNFNYDRQAPSLNQFAGLAGVNQYGGLNFNKRTVAPRIGFAWDIFGTGATVLRGGFSKAYDPGAYIAEGILARNPPYASRLDIVNGTFQLGPNLTAGLPAPQAVALLAAAALNSAQGSIYAIEPKSYTPYADQWGLTLQQRLKAHLSLEAAGVGSMGIHLYQGYDANQPYPAPTPFAYSRYPYPAYLSRVDYLGFAGGSTYYGGEMKITGEPTGRLHLLATYRYAKSLDDSTPPGTTQDSRPATPQYIYNPRGNRSPSPFDIAQRLVATATYDAPSPKRSSWLAPALADWRAGAVITAQSGFPFTPQLAVNSLNNGGYQLPNRVGGGSLPSDLRSYLGWFNTSLNPGGAFAVPALYQYGNSGFDILRGPGMATVDTSLARTFALSEKLRLHTRLEAYNFLNRTNLALPNRILGVESAGAISHTSTPGRQFQVLARVEW